MCKIIMTYVEGLIIITPSMYVITILHMQYQLSRNWVSGNAGHGQGLDADMNSDLVAMVRCQL